MTTETEEKKYFIDCDLCGARVEALKLAFHKATAHDPHPSPHKETPEQTTERQAKEQADRHRELIDVLARIASTAEAIDSRNREVMDALYRIAEAIDSR